MTPRHLPHFLQHLEAIALLHGAKAAAVKGKHVIGVARLIKGGEIAGAENDDRQRQRNAFRAFWYPPHPIPPTVWIHWRGIVAGELLPKGKFLAHAAKQHGSYQTPIMRWPASGIFRSLVCRGEMARAA